MRKQIPNLLTLFNLLSGCIAITLAFQGNFTGAVIAVIAAALFDFLDGLFARLLNAHSLLGKELDSLADVVSFGVAPASALFIFLRDFTLFPDILIPLRSMIPYIAYLIPLFSAYRLAKFNIDDRQTNSFLGLPTPANGLFWISYCQGIHTLLPDIEGVFYITVGLIFVLTPLMVAEVPMFSLKIKKTTMKRNERQILLAILLIAFVALWGIIGISIAILAYILLSLLPYNDRPSNAEEPSVR